MKTTTGANYPAFQAATVRSPQAFSQMRSYILSTYRGVNVEHSFVLGGQYFDCMTVKSQPTVRDLQLTRIATPPAAAPAGHRGSRTVRSFLARGLRDRYGNAIS
ncbi:MAG: hypothetical protein ACRDNF_13340, partial [Streptosporangiaceae bacterium]